MSDAENGGLRFLAFAALQTLLVGFLAGVLGRAVPYSLLTSTSFNYFDPGASDLAAVLAVGTGDAVWTLVVVLPFVVPGFVVANAARGEFPAAAVPLGIGLSLLLFAGLAIGAPVGAAVEDETFVIGGEPYSAQQTFSYHYERADNGRTVLTIRHHGEPPISADELYIEGDSVVAVDGATQTEAGRWQGSTVPGADGPTVDAGNAVAVGVTEGCEIRVVRRDESDAATIGTYDCPG